MLGTLVFLRVFGYVIYYVVNLQMKKRLTEGFTDQGNFLSNYNTHYFLTTSILPGKKDIADLKEINPHHTSFSYVDNKALYLEGTTPYVVRHRQSKLDPRKLTCIKGNAPLMKRIEKYQPYMYNRAELVTLYDHPFYRDWRYPERPIDVRFAANPKKYCAENPHIYPSYKYFSKW